MSDHIQSPAQLPRNKHLPGPSSRAQGGDDAGTVEARFRPEPGRIAIVTDGNQYTHWASDFRDAILARIQQHHSNSSSSGEEKLVSTGIDISQLASRASEFVGVVWLSFSPAGLGEALEAEGSRIKWVQLPSAGIEKQAAVIRAHPETIWTTAKAAYAEPVAEHGLALTLALLRYLPARVIATSWGKNAGNSLFRSNVVILGAGGISIAFLALLAPFHCEVHLVRRNVEDPLELPPHTDPSKVHVHALSALDTLLPQADVIFLACALTSETRGLLNKRTLALLPRHAVVVNVGRGGLIETDALVDALRRGAIGGAGLDVTDPEPLPEGHPLFTLASDEVEVRDAAVVGSSASNADVLVRERANIIITPHTADTPEMVRPLLTERAAANAAALFERAGRFQGLIRIEGEHVY
ncbi:hypothetical protein V8E36_003177 [Tilletia maclaganii]